MPTTEWTSAFFRESSFLVKVMLGFVFRALSRSEGGRAPNYHARVRLCSDRIVLVSGLIRARADASKMSSERNLLGISKISYEAPKVR